MAKYLCVCGRTVERQRTNLPSVKCFDCRMLERRERARGYKVVGPKVSAEERAARREIILERERKRKELLALTAQERKEREFKIIELRLDGLTLEEVAARITPPITRERVRQILERVSRREGVVFPKYPRQKQEPKTKPCKFCGEPKKVFGKAAEEGKEVYHRGCHKSKYLHPDGTKMTKNEISRLRWRTDEARRKKHAALMKKRYLEIMADPELKKHRREKEAVYAKRWHEKKRQDPEWVARQNARARQRYQEAKADPVKYAEMRRRDRERERKWWARKKLSTQGALPPRAT